MKYNFNELNNNMDEEVLETLGLVLETLDVAQEANIETCYHQVEAILDGFNTEGMWLGSPEFLQLSRAIRIVDNALEQAAEDGNMFLDCFWMYEKYNIRGEKLAELHVVLDKAMHYWGDDDPDDDGWDDKN